jgi:hypothetical protein
VSNSPQKIYRRNRTRWIAVSVFVTLCTCAIGLLEETGKVPMVWCDCARSVTIVCWLIAAMVWCTHCVIEEQRRREARTVARMGRLLTEHNVAGWAAYAEMAYQTENVIPIKGRR